MVYGCTTSMIGAACARSAWACVQVAVLDVSPSHVKLANAAAVAGSVSSCWVDTSEMCALCDWRCAAVCSGGSSHRPASGSNSNASRQGLPQLGASAPQRSASRQQRSARVRFLEDEMEALDQQRQQLRQQLKHQHEEERWQRRLKRQELQQRREQRQQQLTSQQLQEQQEQRQERQRKQHKREKRLRRLEQEEQRLLQEEGDSAEQQATSQLLLGVRQRQLLQHQVQLLPCLQQQQQVERQDGMAHWCSSFRASRSCRSGSGSRSTCSCCRSRRTTQQHQCSSANSHGTPAGSNTAARAAPMVHIAPRSQP